MVDFVEIFVTNDAFKMKCDEFASKGKHMSNFRWSLGTSRDNFQDNIVRGIGKGSKTVIERPRDTVSVMVKEIS